MRFKSSSLCQPIVIGLKEKKITQFNREIIINNNANFCLNLILFLLYIFQNMYSFHNEVNLGVFKYLILLSSSSQISMPSNIQTRHMLRIHCSKNDIYIFNFYPIKSPNPYSFHSCKNI